LSTGCGPVTSSSLTGPINGQHLTFKICEDSTGGEVFFWPSNFAGFPAVTLTASGCTYAGGTYDTATTTVYGDGYNAQQCASGTSAAICGQATKGFVAVPTGSNPTLVVDTTAIAATSGILLQFDPTATIAGITCNTTAPTNVYPSSRTPGTSFTITVTGTVSTNPACYFYTLVNP